MFALQNATKSLARRTMSTASSSAPKNPLIPAQYQYSFKESWLSDSSCYPIMFIMGFATSVVLGMSTYASLTYKGVKVRGEQRGQIIPTYKAAYDPRTGSVLTEMVSRHPVGFNPSGFKSLRHEGLGIDHEEWKKQREASKNA